MGAGCWAATLPTHLVVRQWAVLAKGIVLREREAHDMTVDMIC